MLMLQPAMVEFILTLKKLEPHQDNQSPTHSSQQPQDMRLLPTKLLPQEMVEKLHTLMSQQATDIQPKPLKLQPHQVEITPHTQSSQPDQELKPSHTEKLLPHQELLHTQLSQPSVGQPPMLKYQHKTDMRL